MTMNHSLFLLTMSVLAFVAPPSRARVVNVADFGVVSGADATLALNRLIEKLGTEPNITLQFPRGRYEFYPENAFEVYREVANHDNGLKRIAFPLFHGRNVTIDGGGSEFLFHGHMIPFVVDGAKGVTLKNFSIDWQRSFHDELRVVERNEQDKSFIVEVDREKYPYTIKAGEMLSDHYNWQDPMGANIVFDPKTRAPIFNTKAYSLNGAGQPVKAIAVGENRIKLEAAGIKAPPPVGSVLITYGVNPTSRLCPAIHVSNSRDVRIENVTVYEAGGMGLIAERTENIDLNHFVVTSAQGRLVSTRADATHFIGCKGTVRLENCLFEHMLDDGINVHGAYVKVEKYLGANEFLCSISHFQQAGLTFAGPGDKIALLSRETVLPFFDSTVEKVRVLNEDRLVVTLASIPDKLPSGPLSMENLTWYPDVVMQHNVIRENRARSALITTKGRVLIDHNTFSSQMHGILIEGDNNVWYESGAVRDVTISNNVFENVGFEGGAAYPLYVSPLLNATQRMGAGQYHRNINFTHNIIRSFNGLMVFARSVQGLNISGNTMEFSPDYPSIRPASSIDVIYCDQVTIKGNHTEGWRKPMVIAQSADSLNVAMADNPGFVAGQDQPPSVDRLAKNGRAN